MKKAHSSKELSWKICEQHGCSKRLKIRLVETRARHNITHCYRHHIWAENKRGHIMKVR